MSFETWYLFIHLLVAQHCELNEPQQVDECKELIVDCMLDGENFKFCKEHWRSDE